MGDVPTINVNLVSTETLLQAYRMLLVERIAQNTNVWNAFRKG